MEQRKRQDTLGQLTSGTIQLHTHTVLIFSGRPGVHLRFVPLVVHRPQGTARALFVDRDCQERDVELLQSCFQPHRHLPGGPLPPHSPQKALKGSKANTLSLCSRPTP